MKTYTEHTKDCLSIYKDIERTDSQFNIYDLTLDSHDVCMPDAIEILSREFNNRITESDIRKSNFALFLDNIWDLPQFNHIATSLVGHYENIFGMYLHVSHVHAYRTVVSKSQPESSWIWHWDNNPKECIKIMMYLNWVDKNNAPFQYLHHPKDGCKKVETTRVDYKHWRGQPSRVNNIIPYIEQGYEIKSITGPPGTYILFDNNIIHRATSAVEGHRDAIILNLRPSHFKIRPCIGKKYTGSWLHQEPVMDPMQYEPK